MVLSLAFLFGLPRERNVCFKWSCLVTFSVHFAPPKGYPQGAAVRFLPAKSPVVALLSRMLYLETRSGWQAADRDLYEFGFKRSAMNAEPLLNKIARAFAEHRLDAVMIGNAAAALHGAPVTTLDIDFMFRKTPLNLKKLKAMAHGFEAVILRPYYPMSELFRVVNDERGLQLDFMAKVHGVRSFERLRSRSESVSFGEQ